MYGTTVNQTQGLSESQTLTRNPIRYASQRVNRRQAPSGTTIIMQRERDAISGSQIVTATPTPERDANEASGSGEAAADGVEPPVLRLRLMGGDLNRPRVAWDEKVIDNEFLGRKKSKSTSHFCLCARMILISAELLPSLLHLPQTKSVRRIIFLIVLVVLFGLRLGRSRSRAK